ncbi:MAG: class I SAM-dependent methyltransferase [Proteobacteria bacterium]|nr:class I SAM-dependent methyltransferase [Pseudomonadota bacterium]
MSTTGLLKKADKKNLGKKKTAMWGPGGVCYNDEFFDSIDKTDRILEEHIAAVLKLKQESGKRPMVLELGGGTGWAAERLTHAGADVVLVDFGDEATIRQEVRERNQKLGHEAITFIPADICSLSKVFIRELNPDIVMALNVIQYVESGKTEVLFKKVGMAVTAGTIFVVRYAGGLRKKAERRFGRDVRKKRLGRDGIILRNSERIQKARRKKPNFYFHNPYEMRFLLRLLGFSTVSEEDYPLGEPFQGYEMIFRKVAHARQGLQPQPVALTRPYGDGVPPAIPEA